MNAANCYEQLTLLLPEHVEYRLYYAQALHQACLYQEAMKVTAQIEHPEFQVRVRFYFYPQYFQSCIL